MRSQLSAEYYWKENLFKLESEKLFKRMWIFAGLISELPRNNSFFLKKFGDTEVIVQKINGEIVALENVCPHRLNSIHAESAGCRPLVCKYHGWSFEADGSPKCIPLEETHYRFGGSERKAVRMKAFHVHVIGKFIFLNLSPKPKPISSQFKAYMLRDLAHISDRMDDEFEKRVFRRGFNWKLIYENLRDEIHVRFVHAKTLATWAKFNTPKRPRLRFRPHPLSVRSFSYGGDEGDLKPIETADWQKNFLRWTDKTRYHNWLFYPNLHIASASPYHFAVHTHHPVGPTETDVIVYMLTSKRLNPDVDARPLLRTYFEGGEKILDEDHHIVESVQRQLTGTARRPRLGAYEISNLKLESWYLRKLHPWRNFSPVFAVEYIISVALLAYGYRKKFGWPKMVQVFRGGYGT